MDPVSCLYISELLQLPVAVLFPEPTVYCLPTFPPEKGIWKNGDKKQNRPKAQVTLFSRVSYLAVASPS